MGLVVSRKIGEQVVIGDNITITVIGSDRGIVRLNIDAPRDVPVHRSEVADRLRAENGGKLTVGVRRDER